MRYTYVNILFPHEMKYGSLRELCSTKVWLIVARPDDNLPITMNQ